LFRLKIETVQFRYYAFRYGYFSRATFPLHFHLLQSYSETLNPNRSFSFISFGFLILLLFLFQTLTLKMGSKLTSNRSISENACVDSCVKISNEDAEIFWQYGISIDGGNTIQCKICHEIITDGIYKFSCHLARSDHHHYVRN